MKSENFRPLLISRLEASFNKVVLRVAGSPRSDDVVEFTGSELLAKSRESAERYCHAEESEVVLILLPHCAELFLLHLGLILMGRLPAILAWPTNRIDPEKYQRNLLHQLQNLPAAQLLTLPRLAQNLEQSLPFAVTECRVHQYERFEAHFPVTLQCGPRDTHKVRPQPGGYVPEGALFLQFSGGTTGEQKCVVVTAEMLSNQLERLRSTLCFDTDDGVVSWLPLYHDMGLIACFWLPLWCGACSTQFAATDWLLHPGLLFDYLSRFRATFCWLPNFAFSYLAAQKERVNREADLAHVRAFINCSEPVRQRSFEAFFEAFAPQGVRPDQCHASYAMAENVFAVTQTSIGGTVATVSRPMVQSGTTEEQSLFYDLADQVYVSSGQPLPDTSVRIRDSRGNLCGDDEPGEIEIHSQSLFCGYWGSHGFQTQSLMGEGWYATGDYGFQHRGDLFVIGRIKDIIIVSGGNIFPEDIESLVNTLNGIYPGRVVAFGVDDQMQGTESLAIVAEMRGEYDPAAAAGLEHQIRHLITSVQGISARYVRVTPERWIVKSTAGKISRRETRLRFVREFFNHGVAIGLR
jgi:fatty-acyl-CoA synthase